MQEDETVLVGLAAAMYRNDKYKSDAASGTSNTGRAADETAIVWVSKMPSGNPDRRSELPEGIIFY